MTERETLMAKENECLELKNALRELARENRILQGKVVELTSQGLTFCSRCGTRLPNPGGTCGRCEAETRNAPVRQVAHGLNRRKL
jgi:hypothetical protein